MEYCKMQWASRNLTRIIYGPDSSFGLKDINFSLPIDFEVTSDPNNFFTMKDTKDLLLFNYLGHLVNGAQNSLMNSTNTQFLITYNDNPESIAEEFGISLGKAIALANYTKRIMNSLHSIDANAELGYFRGIF
jgi:hypothetical protein